MYCSSCGTAVPQNLSFCNRCGAKVGGPGKSAELSPNALVYAIAAVFLVGLGAIVSLLTLMKQGGGLDPVVLVAGMLSFLMMFVVEGALIWMLLSGRKGAKKAGDAERLREQTTKELGDAQARLLPEPVPSVTEQTTRAFEPSYVERKSK